MIKLNENEEKVLRHLTELYSDSWGEDAYTYFRYIVEGTKLELKVVRRACRSLARKKLAEFMRGLMDDEGQVAGSGYGATQEGRDWVDAKDLVTQELPLS